MPPLQSFAYRRVNPDSIFPGIAPNSGLIDSYFGFDLNKRAGERRYLFECSVQNLADVLADIPDTEQQATDVNAREVLSVSQLND
jgi:hypothetical protein